MNILNNRNKRTNIFKAVALCLIVAVSFTLVSCDDDMDIQQSYPFTVEVMPVPNKVTKGQTVEIRCELKKEGDFAGTLYTIRYFQFEGKARSKWITASPSCPTTATCWRTKSSACTTRRRVTKRIISSWWWRTISKIPTNWNLTSTTAISRMTVLPPFPSVTSDPC